MNNTSREESGARRFGTFGGVFTPSILTILGVIMFMRANFVVARAGIIFALVTLLLCKSITILTSLSIAGISTNTRVQGGGAYFMISRVLGPEFGGSIGLALFSALSLSVPFYILGFTEAVTRSFPSTEPYFLAISLVTASALFVLTWVGAKWAIRAQFFILSILGLAILTYMFGAIGNFSAGQFRENLAPAEGYMFWRIFAIYFPAVTGIDAGVNMSGDLKNPGRSLPLGTFAAVGVGLLVYAAQMLVMGGAADRAVLENQPFEALLYNALFGAGFLVIAGVFAATISSAVGSFMGAPRVMQALARDRIFNPLRIFARGSRAANEPRQALLLTFGITMIVLLLAGSGGGGAALNIVAAIVTMFFLYTYGIINLAAFVESVGKNPSFRPRFRYFHWLTALAGAVTSLTAAFLINPIAAATAGVVVGGIFIYVRSRLLEAAFGDARRGFLYARLRASLLKLRDMPMHAKNWRPTVLVLSGNPKTRPELVRFADWLEGGRGILTIGEILVGEYDKLKSIRKGELERLRRYVREEEVPAFPVVVAAENLDQGIRAMLQAHSLDPLKPNLVLFGWTGNPERKEAFEDNLRAAYSLDMSVIVLREEERPSPSSKPKIDIWWRGEKNGQLLLMLAYLLIQNREWDRARIRVLRAVEEEAGVEPARESLAELINEARIEAEADVVVARGPFADTLRTNSSDSDLIMLGFLIPDEAEKPIFKPSMENMLAGMPPALLVCSTGEADARE